MEFRVPQYIDVEDKLVGPFTLNQLIYLAGGGGMIFVLYELLPLFISVFFIVPIGWFTWALVFFPKERYGKSFSGLMESGIKYYTHPRLYTWKREAKKPEKGRDFSETRAPSAPNVPLPKISEGNLSNLAWDVSVKTDGTQETGHELKKDDLGTPAPKPPKDTPAPETDTKT